MNSLYIPPTMSHLPLVSIIIPVYNVEHFLERCLISIINQSYRNLEIITIDDGSTDSSRNILDIYAEKDHRIVIIHQINQGASAARNIGIQCSHGSYIAFVDADDFIEETMIEKLLGAIISDNSELSMCRYIRHHYQTSAKTYPNIFAVSKCSGIDAAFSILEGKLPVVLWNKLFHKRLLEKTHFPLAKCCEDEMTVPLMVSRAKKVSLLNDLLYNYTDMRTGSFSHSKFSTNNLDRIVAINCQINQFQQYGRRIQNILYRKLYFSILDVFSDAITSNAKLRIQKYLYNKLTSTSLKILLLYPFSFDHSMVLPFLGFNFMKKKVIKNVRKK